MDAGSRSPIDRGKGKSPAVIKASSTPTVISSISTLDSDHDIPPVEIDITNDPKLDQASDKTPELGTRLRNERLKENRAHRPFVGERSKYTPETIKHISEDEAPLEDRLTDDIFLRGNEDEKRLRKPTNITTASGTPGCLGKSQESGANINQSQLPPAQTAQPESSPIPSDPRQDNNWDKRFTVSPLCSFLFLPASVKKWLERWFSLRSKGDGNNLLSEDNRDGTNSNSELAQFSGLSGSIGNNFGNAKYEGWMIYRAEPGSSKDLKTWKRATAIKMPLRDEDLKIGVKKQKNSRMQLWNRYSSLSSSKLAQISRLVDEKRQGDLHEHYE